jgi:hypothetical protein
MAAYMANLPAHWDTQQEQADRPGLEAQLWAVGQNVAAQAALSQLESRAQAANATEATPGIWPEFAEYACDNCHHDLESPSYRQQRRTGAELGRMSWGTWYLSGIGEGSRFGEGDAAASNLAQLRQIMSAPYPDATAVVPLGVLVTNAAGRQRDSAADLRAAVRRAPRTSWDDVAQWYLAASALVEQLERDGEFQDDEESASNQRAKIDAALAELHQALASPFVESSLRTDLEGCDESVIAVRKLLSRWLEENSSE